MKEIAPAPEMHIWLNHEPDKFAEFHQRYITEFCQSPAGTAKKLVARAVTAIYNKKSI